MDGFSVGGVTFELDNNELPIHIWSVQWKIVGITWIDGAIVITSSKIHFIPWKKSKDPYGINNFQQHRIFSWSEINSLKVVKIDGENVLAINVPTNEIYLRMDWPDDTAHSANMLFQNFKTLSEFIQQSKQPSTTFDALNMHQLVIENCRSLFINGHYSEAILNGCKSLNNFIKTKANRNDLDGKRLMSHSFSPSSPLIKLNECITESEINEQEGFMFMYMGCMHGIRNPKAHDFPENISSERALKYLSLISLLIERADEGSTI